MQHEIDEIDKRILNILQQDATLPLKNIAEQVRASVATCQRRIQFMMDTGVITKQVAIINPAALGLELSAFVLIQLARHNIDSHEQFEQLMKNQSRVMSCYAIQGDYDFLLLVHAKNMADYHKFTRNCLNDDHNVQHFKSQFVMNFTEVGSQIAL